MLQVLPLHHHNVAQLKISFLEQCAENVKQEQYETATRKFRRCLKIDNESEKVMPDKSSFHRVAQKKEKWLFADCSICFK